MGVTLERHPGEEYYASHRRDIEYDVVIADMGIGGEVSGANDYITDSVVDDTLSAHMELFVQSLEGDQKEN